MESPVPKTAKDALISQSGPEWEKAMNAEINSLKKHNAFTETTLPEGANLIDSRWVFAIKDLPGLWKRYKARVVAKGFSQVHGVNFWEIFAPVLNLTSLRALVAIAVQEKLPIRQVDVVTAFLHAPLDVDLYMKPAPGLYDDPNTVWKLNKSLYGLKQAPKEWHEDIKLTLLTLGFKQSSADQCVFVGTFLNRLVRLGLYVDDMLIVAETKAADYVIKMLQEKYELKDLGLAQYCLGIEFTRTEDSITLHQQSKIQALLKLTGLEHASPVLTP